MNATLQVILEQAVTPGLLAIVTLIMGLAYKAVEKYLTNLLWLKEAEAEDTSLRRAVTDEVRHVEQVTAKADPPVPSEEKRKRVNKRLKDRGIAITPEVEALIESAVLALGGK